MNCPPHRLAARSSLLLISALCAFLLQNVPTLAIEDTAGGAKPSTTILKGSLQQSEQLGWLAKVGISASPKPGQAQALFVSTVQEGSPAYYGGVAANDRIDAIDSKNGFLKVTIDRAGHFYQASIKADFLKSQTAQIGSTALKGIVGQTRLGGSAQYNQAPITLKQQIPTSGVTHPYSANAIAVDGADGIEQAAYPDCWFEGTLAALAHVPRGQQLICEMIVEREPGYYFVKFPGADEAVTQSQDDRVKYSLNNRAQWANLLEAAVLEKYNAVAVAYSPQGGKSAMEVAMQFLTGAPAVTLAPDSLTPSSLEDLLDRLCRSQTPAAVATRSRIELRMSSPLTENHCYTLMGFDRTTDTVTLRNCYGREPHADPRMGANSRGGGLVDIPLNDFQHFIRYLTYSSR